MNTNTTSNNVWVCNLLKTFSDKFNYQSHMYICKVYKDHIKSNCIDDEFKQQLRHDILNEVRLCSDALKDDVVNVETNKNIEKSYSFNIS